MLDDTNPDEITFRVVTEKKRIGTNTTTKRKLEHEDSDIVTALESLLDKRRCMKPTHLLRKMGLEDGDSVTLSDILRTDIGANTLDFGVKALENEIRLVRYQIDEELSVGDVVEVARNRDEAPKQGVVREIKPATDYYPVRAEITWDGHTWSTLKNSDDFRAVRIGRSRSMGPVHDISVIEPDNVEDDELLEVRHSVLESAEIKQKAEAYDVETEETWTTSGAVEASRAQDHHARVTVSGPGLDDDVTVKLRNAFDIGWTASVERDLDSELERVVKAAARDDSPISTEVRV